MTKKAEQEAITSLEKLEELTQDILKNDVTGGDTNFRQIVFAGLTQTKNQILLDKMKDLLFVETEPDLKKTIILGIFIHKEIFEPVIQYGEQNINMAYIDESYDEKESFLFVLDGLIELAYKNKLNKYESGMPLLMQIYKIACSDKSNSIIADKLLQRFLNSKLGTIKLIQNELMALIKDEITAVNEIVIAVDILARAKYTKTPDAIEMILEKAKTNENNLTVILPIIDIATVALNYFTEKQYTSKVKYILEQVKKIKLNSAENSDAIKRINKRIEKLTLDINSLN